MSLVTFDRYCLPKPPPPKKKPRSPTTNRHQTHALKGPCLPVFPLKRDDEMLALSDEHGGGTNMRPPPSLVATLDRTSNPVRLAEMEAYKPAP